MTNCLDGPKIIFRIAIFTASFIVISLLFLSNINVRLYDTSKNSHFDEKTTPLMISSLQASKVSNEKYCDVAE